MAENRPAKAPEPFIQLLRKAMDEHPEKLSLRQVAARADLSPAYLSLLLSGGRGAPSNDAIARLEMVLNIPQGDLNKAAQKPDPAALAFSARRRPAPSRGRWLMFRRTTSLEACSKSLNVLATGNVLKANEAKN